MKVLQKGSGQKGWAQEFSCSGAGNGNAGCGARLLVEQGDLFCTESHARHETTHYVTFCCPECGQWTDIQNSDSGRSVVPSHVVQKLPYGAPNQDQGGK